MGEEGGGSQIRLDGVVPIRIVGVSASDISPCTMKSRRSISSGTGSPRWFQKKGRKMVVCVCVCVFTVPEY